MFSVLILAYCFAPCTLVGAARMTSLAGFLAQNGNSVTVVSLGQYYYPDDIWTRKVPKSIRHIEVLSVNEPEKEIKRIITKELESLTYDVCLVSMGPFEAQKYLWNICKRNSVPLVLDYRDPWLFNGYYYTNRKLYTKAKRFLYDVLMFRYERMSVRYASAIVSVTKKNTEILRKRYRSRRDNFYTIYNGYDELPMPNEKSSSENGEYFIGCIGKFLYYDEQFAKSFLKVIDKLNSRGFRIKLFHAGEFYDDATQCIAELGVDIEIYHYVGKLGYKDAMSLLQAMDSALIIYRTKEGLGTKVFDYIGLNKPVIYYGIMPSELSDLVSEFPNSIVSNNEKDLEYEIERFVKKHITELGGKNRKLYSREKQNSIYGKLLNDIASMKKTTSR